MVRAARVRALLGLAGVVVVLLAVRAAGIRGELDAPALETALKLAPAAFLGFAFLAVIAPLTANGGNEVFPPDQLFAFPILPMTQYLGGLALAPLNLVWVLQLLTLTAET